ncbi:aminomethyl-transferring glycine dehydrogenase [Amnibacterium sp. CER49]|uniref:aminomethyl-transferring glycine dehydrogenase n=1 Tax=Amnibacterium sp. CER49 TaxID=3039161 RepID=UPI00244CFAA3|nr:aminomethyl-transferring glycine dehydrogenase [Amnibacterium sp. CER49]MDH2445355.1 aminomethyl-transferring glycine dehydrogenase [Amnibacterium sp. CER49]
MTDLTTKPATALEGSSAFAARHIGTDAEAQRRMLEAVGQPDVDTLLATAVPDTIQIEADAPTVLPAAATEAEALAELRALAARNTVRTSMIGLGYSGTLTPAVIRRNVLENPSWYTAYTPYQPEISQGRLEALLNFQTMVSDLTGLATANASMLDEATAVVEAMLLARRASKARTDRFVVDADTLPQTLAVLSGRAAAVGIELVLADLQGAGLPEGDCFGVLVQYPGASGRVWDPSAVIAAAHGRGAIAVAAADLLAATLLKAPGELGADVAAGTTQRFGVPMAMGGPHAGYLAVRAGLERQLPGRLVGVSVDADGAPAYRLSLQAREQHIRREKATSNICTAQVLLAVMASMYAVYHGPAGLRRIARDVHAAALSAAAELRRRGAEVRSEQFFDTILVGVQDADAALARAREHGVWLRRVDATTVGIAFDEVTAADAARFQPDLVAALGLEDAPEQDVDAPDGLPAGLARESEYLTHPVFNTFHSETAMMRYLKYLADLDYALDRGMIPLGSCTMKLNAATEMAAVTWPEFADLHPFAPADDVAGSLELIRQLEGWLSELTGYDAVSLQPNAGSQGELAGLLAIRAYHRANGGEGRTVCLIPSSAHGTNAASAVLAGMKVVVVACDELGNVDLADLHAKIAQHADDLAALMITYPSTHGVYEEQVRQVTDAVHAAGGQVYVDGANLNALLGHARFGDFGGDVSHLNLHKTFCIPHGGGGPGVGPVAAKQHLAAYLPGHPFAQDARVFDGPPVAAAPYGSPGILPISWAYVRMMGRDGLRAATDAAVLAANYVAARLADAYPVLYRGEDGLVAHECILDLRPLTAETGVTVDDVAKRLIDHGFHAPTMSFPVPGTLMVEPTESEDLAELDRFVAAMRAIRAEADRVGAGEWAADDNPLRNAPHTAQAVTADEWTHPYDRRTAAYPFETVLAHGGKGADRLRAVRGKYWPPVRRIDQAYGDRNLVCACPPVDAFA